MRTILSDDEIKRVMSDYRNGGYSNEVLEIAEMDLRHGITKEQQSWYMVKTFEPAKVRSLSEAIREQMPDSLIKLLYRLDRYQIDVVIRQFKAGIPEEELVKVIHKKYSAHDMQKVFEQMQRELMNTKPAPANLKSDGIQPEVNTVDNPIEETEVSDEENKDSDDKQNEQSSESKISGDKQDDEKTVVVDEQKVERQVLDEMFVKSIEKMTESFALTVSNLMEPSTKNAVEIKKLLMEIKENGQQNAGNIDPVAEQRLNETIDDMEKKIKSLNKELEMSAGIIATKESEIAGLKERVRKMEASRNTDNRAGVMQDERLRHYAERMNMIPKPSLVPTSETARNNKGNIQSASDQRNTHEYITSGDTQERKQSGMNIGTITSDMSISMTMPDGSVVPVKIERTDKKNQKGMAAFATRFFNGSPWQNSLLNMLIDGHLNKNQLEAIKKARDYHFSDQEIKELIESGLPAEEMSGIIEVVMADRR